MTDFTTEPASLAALVVDDEPLARAHLRRLLETLGVRVVAEAASATDALLLAEMYHPDALFLDIEMPGLSGMHLAAAVAGLDPAPEIVFVTGYSQYAVAAFERNALDYLVKPVAADRLLQTVTRLRQASRVKQASGAKSGALPAFLDVAPSAPLRRLPVRTDYAVRLLRLPHIVVCLARDKKVTVRTQTETDEREEFRTYYSLAQLEKLLPGPDAGGDATFLRVHESALVNLDRVEELLFLGNHDYELRLSDDSAVPVGRTRYAELRRRLGLSAD